MSADRVTAEPGDPTMWTQVGVADFETMSRPAVANYSDGRVFVFVVVTGNGPQRVEYTFTDDIGRLTPSWHAWTDLGAPPGGVADSPPSAVSWADGRLDLFVRGTDGQLWHTYWPGTNPPTTQWARWEPLGGQLTSAPAVVTRGAGTLDVFVRGTDGQLWHKWWNGFAWLGWEPLGGQLVGEPAGVGFESGEIEVVVRGTDNAMWIKLYDPVAGGWSGWFSAGGVLTGPPADDYLQMVVPGLANQLWAFRYDEGYHRVGPLPPVDSAPSTISTFFCGDPECTTVDTYTEIFAIDDNQIVWASDPGPTLTTAEASEAGFAG